MTELIYTDGSYNAKRDRGGWAAVFKDRAISGGKYETSSHEMELTAVVEAIRLSEGPVCVITDLKSIEDRWKQKKLPKENRELWEELYRLTEGREVEIVWKPGHVEEAQQEAHRLASRESRKGR